MRIQTSVAMILAFCAPLAITNALAVESGKTALSMCRTMDANGDGVIARDEGKLSADLNVSFEVVDKGGSEKITVARCARHLQELDSKRPSQVN